jgi:hypothetical protein
LHEIVAIVFTPQNAGCVPVGCRAAADAVLEEWGASMLEKAMAALADVQHQLNAIQDAEDAQYDRKSHPDYFPEPDWRSRLLVSNIGGRLAVEYYGQNYEAQWDAVQMALASPDVAPQLALVRLTGPDDGANGLRTWDFKTLLAAKPFFPQLTHVHIEPTEPSHHNFSVVEDEQLPPVLATMPYLRRLVLPQAPEPAFFSLALDELRYLRIGMEHRTRGFIEHLAMSRSLPALVKLDFADSLGPWLNTKPQPPEWTSTPFRHYEALLRSTAVPQMKVLFLRNAKLTEKQFRTLQDLRKDLQLASIIATPLVYVRHWGSSQFPYSHVLPR